MAKLAAKSEMPPVVYTAVTVMNSESGPALCPFFAKCDGVMVFNGAGSAEVFYPNRARTADSMCNLLLEIRPNRLVCGFIAAPERNRLRAAEIEVRLGSCVRSVAELVGGFDDLAVA